MPKLLVMFGTQTGNCREVAKQVSASAGEIGFDSRVVDATDFKKVDFADEPLLVLITSSTGNGDCPDNAERFYRMCKKRDTPADKFAGVRFCVCALGDSNYELFCNIGRDFDKHLERLGGQRFLKRCEVDEVDGIETHVEPWMELLMKTLKELPAAEAGGGGVADGAAAAAATRGDATAAPAAAGEGAAGAGTPAGAAAEEEVAEDAVGGSAEHPLLAPIVGARWLTAPPDAQGPTTSSAAVGGAKRVLHCEVDVSAAGAAMRFVPGDALGVLPRNSPDDVAAVVALLGCSSEEPMPALGEPPSHLRDVGSVGEALSSRVDLGSVSVWPPLPLLRLLLSSTTLASAEAGLAAQVTAAVAGGGAGRAAHAALQKERPPLQSLLSRLKCTPPLAELLDSLPPLAPRYYSIANAPAADPGKVHLCLTVVDYTTTGADGRTHEREGVASNMLSRLCAPLLEGATPSPPPSVLCFHREASGNEMRLPTDPSVPVALVGPGTGLAPFRAFLQHRKLTWPRKALGPCHLFFGCRAEAVDYLYSDELRPMGMTGLLQLHTAFSRSREPCSAGSWRGARLNVPYVQDRIDEAAPELAEMLYKGNGRVYVCGDGQWMAADVHAALRRVGEQQLGLTAEEAEARLGALAEEGRYTREIWN